MNGSKAAPAAALTILARPIIYYVATYATTQKTVVVVACVSAVDFDATAL